MFSSIKKLHFVGIGGIGMSGIAELLLNQGFLITGSDRAASENTDRLSSLGVRVYIGHKAENLEPDVDVLVYSSAVPPDNPELVEAHRRGIPVIRRAEMLAEVMRLKYGIGIAGTHGKTTTTTMIGLVLMEGGIDPTVIVGGRVNLLAKSNARLGHGEFIVVEADEYDRSFLSLTPAIAVLTTLETDHLDCYRDLEDIKAAFVQFAGKVPFYGFVVLCLDEPALQDIMPKIKKKIVTYGLNGQADLQAVDIVHRENTTAFTVMRGGQDLGAVTLHVPGRHNVQNALAAITVGLELRIPFEKIQSALAGFAGVQRRFQIRGRARDVLVVDDYGHHPAEIRATLAAAKAGFDRRVITVFQPHRYSRTQHLRDDFLTAFYQSDVLIVMDIYAAGEAPIPGVHARDLADGIAAHGHREVLYLGSDRAAIIDYLCESTRAGDLVLTLGAGDVGQLGGELLQRLGDDPGTSSKGRP